MSARRPRVAVVSDAIAPFHRGGKEHRYEEVVGRLKRSCDVHVYTMKWWAGPRRIRLDGVTYHAVCPRLPMYTRGRRSILQAVLFAIACLRLVTARFDVVEADQIPYFPIVTLRLVATLRHKRFVATWHEVWGRPYWLEYLGWPGRAAAFVERLSIRLPDEIIAASQQTADRLVAEVPAVDGRVTYAPNGIDLSAVAAAPPAAERTDLVFVGRLLEHKGLDLVLHTLAALRRTGRDLTLTVVGTGPDLGRLQGLAASKGVDDLVSFRTDVDQQATVYGIVKSARVFVFPSRREGFGIAPLEAIACGARVVTTNSPDNLSRFLVARSGNGVVCDHTVKSLGGAITMALRSDDPRPPDSWVSEYDWDVVVGQIERSLWGGDRRAPVATGSLLLERN